MDKGRDQVDKGRGRVDRRKGQEDKRRGQEDGTVAEFQGVACYWAEVCHSTSSKTASNYEPLTRPPYCATCCPEEKFPRSSPPTSPSLSPPGGPGVGTMPFFRHLSISTAFHFA